MALMKVLCSLKVSSGSFSLMKKSLSTPHSTLTSDTLSSPGLPLATNSLSFTSRTVLSALCVCVCVCVCESVRVCVYCAFYNRVPLPTNVKGHYTRKSNTSTSLDALYYTEISVNIMLIHVHRQEQMREFSVPNMLTYH